MYLLENRLKLYETQCNQKDIHSDIINKHVQTLLAKKNLENIIYFFLKHWLRKTNLEQCIDVLSMKYVIWTQYIFWIVIIFSLL